MEKELKENIWQEQRGDLSHFIDSSNAHKRAHSIKWKILEQLDSNLLSAESKLIQLGCKTLWAKSAKQAQEHIQKVIEYVQPESIVNLANTYSGELSINPKSLQTQVPYWRESRWKSLDEKLIPVQCFNQEEQRPKTEDAEKFIKYSCRKDNLAIVGPSFMTLEGSMVFNSNDSKTQVILEKAREIICLIPITNLMSNFGDIEMVSALQSEYAKGEILPANCCIWQPGKRKNVYVLFYDNGRIEEVLSKPELRKILTDIHFGSELSAHTASFVNPKKRLHHHWSISTESAIYRSITKENKLNCFSFLPLLFKTKHQQHGLDPFMGSLITAAKKLQQENQELSNTQKWGIFAFKKLMNNRKLLDWPSASIKKGLLKYVLEKGKTETALFKSVGKGIIKEKQEN